MHRNEQELRDAEGLREAALVDQGEARNDVEAAEAVVVEAASALEDAKKAKEVRRQEAQVRLVEARRDTGAQEREKDNAERVLSQHRSGLQSSRGELDNALHELEEAERRVRQMREASAAARERRASLNEDERFILDQEVKLVLQRLALEEKESKHYSDLRSFDDNFRPNSPPNQRPSGLQARSVGNPVPPPQTRNTSPGLSAQSTPKTRYADERRERERTPLQEIQQQQVHTPVQRGGSVGGGGGGGGGGAVTTEGLMRAQSAAHSEAHSAVSHRETQGSGARRQSGGAGQQPLVWESLGVVSPSRGSIFIYFLECYSGLLCGSTPCPMSSVMLGWWFENLSPFLQNKINTTPVHRRSSSM